MKQAVGLKAMASTSAPPIGQQGRVVVRGDVEGLGFAEGPGDESRVRLIQQAEPNLVRLRERGLRYKVQIVKDSLIPRVHQEQQLVKPSSTNAALPQ